MAAAMIGRDSTDQSFEYIDELVGWRRWITIALDNIPRAVEFYDRKAAMSQYLEIIKLRHHQFIALERSVETSSGSASPGAEFIPAHLPQLILRISEYIKNYMEIDVDDRGDYTDSVMYWVLESKNLLHESKNYSSLPNDRIISLLEAISYFALTNDNDQLIKYVNAEIRAFDGKLSYRNCGKYVQNWRKALNDDKYNQYNLTKYVLAALPDH